MGKFDDPTPKVQSIGDEPERPSSRPRTIAGVALVAIVASSAFFLSTGTDETPPLSTLPFALPTSTTVARRVQDAPSIPPSQLATDDFDISERTGHLVDSARAVRDAVPEVDGELAALIGTPAGTDLIRIQIGQTEPTGQIERPTGAFDLAFDRSAQLLAYLSHSPPTTDHSSLYIESRPIADADSFAWHATIPARIAWATGGTDPQLCWTDIDATDMTGPPPVCVQGPGLGFQLVGFDGGGFITIDRSGRSIGRFDPDGQRVASVAGDDVELGPSDRLLVIDRGTGTSGATTFTVTTQEFADPHRLDWAPPNPVVAAWSQSTVYPEIAFMTWDNDHFQLQVYDLQGRLNHAVDLEGRVWGLEWDSTGRYLLVPGILEETDGILYIYDTSEDRQTLTTLPFGGWVIEAVLVTPTECVGADRVMAGFSLRMPTDVTLSPAQMVVSRDSHLLSFTFVSARIIGGSSDGQVATWALPGFAPSAEGQNEPTHIMAVNEAAASLGLDNTALPGDFDSMDVDGALDSQHCLGTN